MVDPVMRIADDQPKKFPRRFNFTIRSIAAVRVPAGKNRTWAYDAHTRNLAYMLTAKGSASFYWIGKLRGRPVRHLLGDAQIGVENARKLATARTVDRAKGIDFHGERKALRAESTIGELWTRYLETYAKPQKRSWAKDLERYNKHLADWASRRVSAIRSDDVAALHARIGKTHPGAANRVLSLISAIFSKTKYPTNPARGVTRFPERKRDRALLPDEMRRFFKALKDTPQPWRDLFEIALLTGQRIGNIRSMRWNELSLPDSVWRIPGEKFKTKEPHSVALAPRVAKILKSRNHGQSDWVFPASSASGYVRETKGPWGHLCKRARLDGVWVHDLRATNATMQAELNTSSMLIQRSLGHRSMQTTQRYVRLALDPLRRSAVAAAAAMLKTSQTKKPKKSGTRNKRKSVD